MKKSAPIRIVMLVTNDLEGDQRVHKMALSLLNNGWEPYIIGRKMADSKPLERVYPVKRIKMLFKRGPAFYTFFNARVFFRLLFTRANLFVANDLDTLVAAWLASVIRGVPVVYDSHEYFTEVPELVGRKKIQAVWKFIERKIQPRLKYVITVNDSIAELFRTEYPQEITIIRNLPMKDRAAPVPGSLPPGFTDRPVIIYQGAVNAGRGLEELLAAMHHLPAYNLIIAGGGDRLAHLRHLVAEQGLAKQVYFTGRVPFQLLQWYTLQASLGLSLEQDLGLNYRFSLPNKLFDYMHAGIPVVASDLPEIRKIVNEAGFGRLIKNFSPEALSSEIKEILEDKDLYREYCVNARNKAGDYCWESQEGILIDLYSRALGQV